jgi:hypothetical protein
VIALTWFAAARGRRAFVRASLAGATALAFILAPLVLEGALPNFGVAMRSLTQHDMVSGNATNVWWLYTWGFRAMYDLDLGFVGAFVQPVRILALSTVEELGHPSPAMFATTLVALFFVFSLWRATRWAGAEPAPAAPDRPSPVLPALAAALACLLVHTYYMFAVRVHENHLFLALPLALVAAIHLSAYRRVALVIGLVQALNLFAFYGISEGIGWTPSRQWSGVDVTVPLALVSVIAWGWHLGVFVRLTRTASARNVE